MANLVVSDVCNMRCSYCFAKEYLSTAKNASHRPFITLEQFETHLDFLERSNINEVRLIGGEPTLHPQFQELIERALRRNKHIMVFSHGLMPEKALASLETLTISQCTVLINANASRTPNLISEREHSHRQRTLQRLGERAFPGFTIYTANFQLDYLHQLILETNCRKSIRIGLAQPILGSENAYLHPKQYPFVGKKLVAFAQAAAQDDIRVELDCGFVRCMFSDTDLATLSALNVDFGWHCNPVLDIGLDGQVIHCFPLTSYMQFPLDSAKDASHLRSMMMDKVRAYRTAGIYKECSTCIFKHNGECTGGCLGPTMRRFRQASISLRITSVTSHVGCP